MPKVTLSLKGKPVNSKNNELKSEHDNGCILVCVLICIGLFLGTIIGAFLGAFILSFLQYEYYVYFKPDFLNDGQFGMLFLNTIAIGGIGGGFLGGLLGGISGFLIARKVPL